MSAIIRRFVFFCVGMMVSSTPPRNLWRRDDLPTFVEPTTLPFNIFIWAFVAFVLLLCGDDLIFEDNAVPVLLVGIGCGLLFVVVVLVLVPVRVELLLVVSVSVSVLRVRVPV